MCGLLLHGYSVDNLMNLNEEIFYEQVNLCQIELSIIPAERTGKAPEAKNSRFFIAEFSFKRLSPAAIATQESIFKGMPLWREDTLTGDAELILSYATGGQLPLAASGRAWRSIACGSVGEERGPSCQG